MTKLTASSKLNFFFTLLLTGLKQCENSFCVIANEHWIRLLLHNCNLIRLHNRAMNAIAAVYALFSLKVQFNIESREIFSRFRQCFTFFISISYIHRIYFSLQQLQSTNGVCWDRNGMKLDLIKIIID